MTWIVAFRELGKLFVEDGALAPATLVIVVLATLVALVMPSLHAIPDAILVLG